MHAVMAENWVVYTYWSRVAHRFQSSVVELYDDSPRSLSAAQLVFGSTNSTVSSYRPVELEACLSTTLPSLISLEFPWKVSWTFQKDDNLRVHSTHVTTSGLGMTLLESTKLCQIRLLQTRHSQCRCD